MGKYMEVDVVGELFSEGRTLLYLRNVDAAPWLQSRHRGHTKSSQRRDRNL